MLVMGEGYGRRGEIYLLPDLENRKFFSRAGQRSRKPGSGSQSVGKCLLALVAPTVGERVNVSEIDPARERSHC
jgi:hypothetical protein